MDSLYFLIPISIVFVLVIGGVLAWAVMSGQFDGLEQEGRRILDEGHGPAGDETAPAKDTDPPADPSGSGAAKP